MRRPLGEGAARTPEIDGKMGNLPRSSLPRRLDQDAEALKNRLAGAILCGADEDARILIRELDRLLNGELAR
jgi:hypothetical protein